VLQYAENTDKRVCPCHPIAAFLLHVGAYSRAEGQLRRGEQYVPTLFASTLNFLYIELKGYPPAVGQEALTPKDLKWKFQYY